MQIISDFIYSSVGMLCPSEVKYSAYIPNLKGRIQSLSENWNYYIDRLSDIFITKVRNIDFAQVAKVRNQIELDVIEVRDRIYSRENSSLDDEPFEIISPREADSVLSDSVEEEIPALLSYGKGQNLVEQIFDRSLGMFEFNSNSINAYFE